MNAATQRLLDLFINGPQIWWTAAELSYEINETLRTTQSQLDEAVRRCDVDMQDYRAGTNQSPMLTHTPSRFLLREHILGVR